MIGTSYVEKRPMSALFVNLSFFKRLSRPPKGWQNTKTEKAKGPKITTKLQKQET